MQQLENYIYSIKTQRLIVRKYRMSDASILKETIDKNLDHLMPWMPWVKREPTSLEEKQALLRNWIQLFDSNDDYFYGIFSPDNKTLIGSSGLHTRLGTSILEIGYWIASGEINKGYATEVAYALTKIGLTYLGVEKMEIRVDPKNVRSGKIPAKLGYMQEYSLRSLFKDENGERILHNAWTLFKEEFRLINDYEPVVIKENRSL